MRYICSTAGRQEDRLSHCCIPGQKRDEIGLETDRRRKGITEVNYELFIQ